MQIQPFKRPNFGQIEATRTSLCALRDTIAHAYAWPKSMRQTSANDDNDPLESTGPKVGDLHPWDALVDGCLYLDVECDVSRPYLMRYNGAWIWMCSPDEALTDWRVLMRDDERRPSHAYSSPMALVLATSIDTAEKCRDAIAAHKSGGAK